MNIDWIKTLVMTIIMLIAVLILDFVPALLLFIAPFMLIPAYLYIKNRPGFYVMSAFVIIVSLFVAHIFTVEVVVAMLLASYITGTLLQLKASKEMMLFILTTALSMYTLLTIILFQLTDMMPTTVKWFSDLKQSYKVLMENEVGKDSLSADNLQLFYTSIDQLQLQVPGMIVFAIFLLVLLSLLIAMPLLRNFKIATPDFRPLYLWHIPKSVFYLYLIAVITKLFLTADQVVPLGIVTNLQYVLEWIIFIQGLSVVSFFLKVKKTNTAVQILIYIFAFIMAPVTQLIGMIDMIINLKARIKL